MHAACHLDRGLKLMKASEIVCLASQHLDSSDLFLLNHGKLPLSLSHQVLYQLIVLFVYLTVPAVRDKLFVHAVSLLDESRFLFVPLELCSGKTRNWVCLQTFTSSGAQHGAVQRQHLPLRRQHTVEAIPSLAQSHLIGHIATLTCSPDNRGALFMYVGLLRFADTNRSWLVLFEPSVQRRSPYFSDSLAFATADLQSSK